MSAKKKLSYQVMKYDKNGTLLASEVFLVEDYYNHIRSQLVVAKILIEYYVYNYIDESIFLDIALGLNKGKCRSRKSTVCIDIYNNTNKYGEKPTTVNVEGITPNDVYKYAKLRKSADSIFVLIDGSGINVSHFIACSNVVGERISNRQKLFSYVHTNWLDLAVSLVCDTQSFQNESCDNYLKRIDRFIKPLFDGISFSAFRHDFSKFINISYYEELGELTGENSKYRKLKDKFSSMDQVGIAKQIPKKVSPKENLSIPMFKKDIARTMGMQDKRDLDDRLLYRKETNSHKCQLRLDYVGEVIARRFMSSKMG